MVDPRFVKEYHTKVRIHALAQYLSVGKNVRCGRAPADEEAPSYTSYWFTPAPLGGR